jgi:hypothetical protein
MSLKKIIKNSTKKLITIPLVVGALVQPSYSLDKQGLKTAAAAIGGIVCYTHPEYQIKKNTCIIDRLLGVDNYGKEVDIEKPYEVRFADKMKVNSGGEGFIFCYRKPGEKDDDFCVAAVVEPPQLYFSKLKKQKEEEEARCNRRHIRRPSFIAGVNGAYTAGINGSYTAGINGSYTAGVNGAYTAGVTPLEDDCK